MDAHPIKSFGLIKWFGGRNGKTGKENNFGFIQDVSGGDIYLNRNDWEDTAAPVEGELVTYVLTEKKGKPSAQSASRALSASSSALDVYKAIQKIRSTDGAAICKLLHDKLCGCLCILLPQAHPAELQDILDCQPALIYEIVSRHPKANENFDFMVKNSQVDLTGLAWTSLPSSIVDAYEATIAQEFAASGVDIVIEKYRQRDALPASLIVFLLIMGVFPGTLQLGRKNSELAYLYLHAVLFLKTRTFPDYLQAAFTTDLALNGDSPASPVLADMPDSLRFKHSLYEKSHAFIDIFTQSPRLQRNLETFVLGKLFSLIVSNNSDEVIFNVFLQQFWEGLISGALRLEKQEARILKLFPSCRTMHGGLSCEAVYWSKQEKYLCRGRHCVSPSVLPSMSQNYLDFTIYDWLGHYGINYFDTGKPTSRDFPIKLAGYINRIRELHEHIHCRSCADLMLPDMRYARTEYVAWESGVATVKEMSAAYRLTVFHCNHVSCRELGKKHYISHCVGCYHIIDSRTLKRQCDKGMYICGGCGSCCAKHKDAHPAGLCPECTAPLEVREKAVQGYKQSYRAKYVECSACAFTIDHADLPSRFKSMSALPA